MENKKTKILNEVSFFYLTNWSVSYLLDFKFDYNQNFELYPIGSFLTRNRNLINIQDNVKYSRVTVKVNNNGVFLRDVQLGKNIGTKKQYIVQKSQFIISKIDARNGSMGIIPNELDGAIVTNDFPTFFVDNNKINSQFLLLLTTTTVFINFAQSCSSGTTNRQRINIEQFLNIKIPLPSLSEQNRIVKNYNEKINLARKQEKQAEQLETNIENYLFEVLGIEKLEEKEVKKGLQFVNYSILTDWNSANKNISKYKSFKYPLSSILLDETLAISVFRGKSPKYDKNGTSYILNQKCNRWNYLEKEHSKKVNDDWYNKINSSFFTKENDILINSTGEGTIGRATCIEKENVSLLYDSHILLLRLDITKINPQFYTYLFNSKYGQQQVSDIKSAQSTKQTELGINNLKKIMFPLPDNLKTQTQIANHISGIKEQIKNLKTKAEQNRANAIKEFEQEIFTKN